MKIGVSEITGISDLKHHQEWLNSKFNQIRQRRFKKRESLFSLEYENDIPIGQSPLPKRDQMRIASFNATELWKPAISQCFSEKSLEPITENKLVSGNQPTVPQSVNDEILLIEEFIIENSEINSGNVSIKVDLSEEESKKMKNSSTLLIDYSEDTIEPYKKVDNTSQHQYSEEYSQFQKLQTYAVAGGAFDVSHISVQKDSDVKQELERLELKYSLIGESDDFETYIIANPRRGRERVNMFFNEQKPENISQYCDFFGFPTELSNLATRGPVDSIPSEEHVLYAYVENKFDDEELESVLLAPYTNPPSKKGVSLAAQVGRQVKLSAEAAGLDESVIDDALKYRMKCISEQYEPFIFPLSALPISTIESANTV
jgi:hypothetical protein